MDARPFQFEDWETALRETVAPELQRGYREAIVKFRYWLRKEGKQPDVETFKAHLTWKQSYLSPERFELRRNALRWYYGEGLRRMKATAQEPPKTPSATGYASASKDQTAQTAPSPTAAPSTAVKTGKRDMNGYRTYEMNDVPTAGARDLGGGLGKGHWSAASGRSTWPGQAKRPTGGGAGVSWRRAAAKSRRRWIARTCANGFPTWQ